MSIGGRYALVAVIRMARCYRCGEYITVFDIVENLGVSKIYLGQTFPMSKQTGIIFSVKGAQGNYQLVRAPVQTTVLDILVCVELSSFENIQGTITQYAPDIEKVLRASASDLLNQIVQGTLSEATPSDLAAEVKKNEGGYTTMFYTQMNQIKVCLPKGAVMASFGIYRFNEHGFYPIRNIQTFNQLIFNPSYS